MSATHRNALESLWRDRCTVTQWAKVTDPDTKLTGFQESPLLTDQPCKLSFETVSAADGVPVAAISQAVKLFLSPDVVIPAGCKVVVIRNNDMERTMIYSSTGEPAVFHDHQEIALTLFQGWA